jgi:hypothetical protein
LGISLAGERVLRATILLVISDYDEAPAINHNGFHPGVVGAPSLQKALLRGGVALEQRRWLKFIHSTLNGCRLDGGEGSYIW